MSNSIYIWQEIHGGDELLFFVLIKLAKNAMRNSQETPWFYWLYYFLFQDASEKN